MPTELEQLLAVQVKDLDIRELQRKVDHLGSRQAQYRKQLDQLAARNRKRHEALEAKRVEAKRLSSEVDHLDEHIRNQEKKLENEIVSLKEMEAIKSSLDHGHQRIDQLEEQALALMDEVEAEADKLQNEDDTFQKHKAQFESEIAKAEAEAQAQRDRRPPAPSATRSGPSCPSACSASTSASRARSTTHSPRCRAASAAGASSRWAPNWSTRCARARWSTASTARGCCTYLKRNSLLLLSSTEVGTSKPRVRGDDGQSTLD